MSNPETTTIEVPLVKKSKADLPRIKYTYFNTTSRKNEDFFVYDYMSNLRNFGFNWENSTLKLRYFIKIVGNKIQRRLTLGKNTTKMLSIDEQRIFNVHYSIKRDLSDAHKKFATILMAYLQNPRNDNNEVFNFSNASKKNLARFIKNVSASYHYNKKIVIGSDFFASFYYHKLVTLWIKNKNEYLLQEDLINRLFVPKFYHDRRDKFF